MRGRRAPDWDAYSERFWAIYRWAALAKLSFASNLAVVMFMAADVKERCVLGSLA